MKKFEDLEHLIFKVNTNFESNGFLFIKKEAWLLSPFNTEIYLFETEGEMDIDSEIDDDEPILAIQMGLQSFFDFATFQDIIKVQKGQKNKSSYEEYFTAIKHFEKYDSFKSI